MKDFPKKLNKTIKQMGAVKIKAIFLGILIMSGFFVFDLGALEAEENNNDGIIITEVMYDPKGGDNLKTGDKKTYEYVVLKNISDQSINITEWKVRLGTYYNLEKVKVSVPSGGKIIIYNGKGVDRNLDFKNGKTIFLYRKYEKSKLGDNYGEVVLYKNKKTNKDTIVDYVVYGKIKIKIIIDKKTGKKTIKHTINYNHAIGAKIWTTDKFVEKCNKGEYLKLKKEKENTDYQDWVCEKKSQLEYDLEQEEDSQGQEEQERVSEKYSTKIYINEVLPNPIGKEKENEFIELYNNSNEDVDLENWTLKDGSKTGKFVFLKSAIIKAKNFLTVYRQSFKFALNNTGNEKVYLLSPNGEVVDQLEYEKAKENISYNLDIGSSNRRWSKYLTPNKKNKFDKIPKIEIKIDKKAYKNIYVNFKVKIKEADKSKLKITWDFGDGHKSYKKETRHKYLETGKYSGSVKIFTGSESVVRKFKIKVGKFSKPKVKIVALMPNPKGKDSEGEWVEIKNKSKKKINLRGWSIATGTKSNKLINHPINIDIIIKPHKSIKITKKDSLFSLGNKKCKIELRYPTGKVAYRVKYKKEKGVKDDEVYLKKKGEKWRWVESYEARGEIIIQKEKQVQVDNKESNLGLENKKQAMIKNTPDKDSVDIFTNNQSSIKQEKITRLLLETKIKQEEGQSIEIQEGEKFVLGVEASKKVRLENGRYYFTKVTVPKKHYAKKFLDDTVIKLNSRLNMLK